jgi:hypothetical protein
MTSLFRITHKVLVLPMAGRDVPALSSLGNRVISVSLKLGEIMKFRLLVFSVIAFGLTAAAWTEDFKALAAKGYRWVTVNGPFACATEQDVRHIISDPTDSTELNMVEDGGAYYLIPGTIVQVVQDDQINGMSQILIGGIVKPLWTYTGYLSVTPVTDTYGVIETPKNAGLIETGDIGEVEIPDEPVNNTKPIPPAPR